MRRFAYVVLGLALLVGALAFAGYRQLATTGTSSKVATRSVAPQAAPSSRALPRRDDTKSGLQLFELGLNVANVIVGVLGIWMTMRGLRAERRAEAAFAERRRRD